MPGTIRHFATLIPALGNGVDDAPAKKTVANSALPSEAGEPDAPSRCHTHQCSPCPAHAQSQIPLQIAHDLPSWLHTPQIQITSRVRLH